MPSLHKSRSLSPLVSLRYMDWRLFSLLFLLTALGIAILYSAGRASCVPATACLNQFGGWNPWALSQLPKVALGFALLIIAALVDIKVWVASAYWIYGASIIALVLVALVGHTGMGAQRWLSIGFMRFQPSEFAKIGVVLALARYFSGLGMNEIRSIKHLIIPALIVGLPVLLVVMQPDLGTALSIAIVATLMFFIVGVEVRNFVAIALAAMLAAPVVWTFGLHDYQKSRILIFLDPERDVMGGGYHIMQSKITIGSGGIAGKGYLQGTQSHLNFLPEKQTDFIFTMFVEEFGMIGALVLFAIIAGILARVWRIAYESRSNFGKMLAAGVGINFFVYFFVNTAMVMGLLPIVGVPSPLLSYGGTSMIVILFGFGLAQNCYVHKDEMISGKSSYL